MRKGIIWGVFSVLGVVMIAGGYFGISSYLETQKQKELTLQTLIETQQQAIQKGQDDQKILAAKIEQDKIDTQAQIEANRVSAQAKIDAERRANQIAQANLKKQIDEKPATIIQNNTIVEQEIDIAKIVREWRPQVGYILCDFGYSYGTGSGLLRRNSSGLLIQTNRHVMYGVNACAIRFPDNSQIFTVKNDSAGLMRVASSGQDWGYMYLTPNSQLSNVRLSQNCVSSASVGEKIIVIGYPGIGSANDVTVTEGIISGFEGDYYITSAKIEHGNSGGAAIDLKRNCYLGIPTAVVVGKAESLGRILDIKKMK